MQKYKSSLLLLILLVSIVTLGATGCSGGGYARLLRGESEPSGYGSVDGKILCADDIDFTLGYVKVNGNIVSSDISPEGMYNVENLLSGTIRIEASNSDYISWKEYVTIISDKEIDGPDLILFKKPPSPPASSLPEE